MGKIFILSFLFFSAVCFSQTHRFIYEQNYKKDSTENIITKELFHLDVNPDESFFYSRDYFVLDSLIKNMIEPDFSTPPNLSEIYTHKKGSNTYSNYEIIGFTTYKFDTTDKQEWTLTDEKKKIDQYNVQKAEATWGGRKWTAWFSTEIPFSEGPYKFHSLPGLIMEISDSGNNYSFKVVKSENYKDTYNVNDFFAFFLGNVVPVTEERLIKHKQLQYRDPIGFIQMQDESLQLKGDNQIMLKDGTRVSQANQKEVVLQQQKKLKKYNNPIEVNKAIKYQ